jgi:hypothetical protein
VPLTFFHRIRDACPTRAQWAKLGCATVYLAAVVIFLVSVGRFYQKNTGFTSLIHFGSRFYDRTLPAVRYARHATAFDTWGDDGQFYAQMAVEPLLRNRQLDVALDNAPYRSRRILFAWTAYLLGLGQPEWILKAYAMQNIVAWLVLAGVLLYWFPPARARNVLPWIGCLYSAGMLISVRLSMLDGLSITVVTLAILAHERHCGWLATGLMAMSGLGRETNLIGSGLLVNRVPRTRQQILAVCGTAACVVLPFLLWSRYLTTIYPSFSYSNPDNFSVPFSGYLTKWSKTLAEYGHYGWHSNARFHFAVLIGLSVQMAFLALRWEWKSAWWRMAAPYCLIFAMISYPVWGGLPGAAPRVLLPLTFAFNVLVARLEGWSFWALVILGNVSVVSGIAAIETPWLSTLL